MNSKINPNNLSKNPNSPDLSPPTSHGDLSHSPLCRRSPIVAVAAAAPRFQPWTREEARFVKDTPPSISRRHLLWVPFLASCTFWILGFKAINFWIENIMLLTYVLVLSLSLSLWRLLTLWLLLLCSLFICFIFWFGVESLSCLLVVTVYMA